jgi:hypothetical protein
MILCPFVIGGETRSLTLAQYMQTPSPETGPYSPYPGASSHTARPKAAPSSQGVPHSDSSRQFLRGELLNEQSNDESAQQPNYESAVPNNSSTVPTYPSAEP